MDVNLANLINSFIRDLVLQFAPMDLRTTLIKIRFAIYVISHARLVLGMQQINVILAHLPLLKYYFFITINAFLHLNVHNKLFRIKTLACVKIANLTVKCNFLKQNTFYIFFFYK